MHPPITTAMALGRRARIKTKPYKGNGCHEHAFYWWRSKLGLSPRCGNGGRRRRQPNALRFAEVVIDPRPAAEAIVLRLGGGRELVLPASMPAESVAKLVRSIEGAA
jgi:hypothetical protein